MSKRNKKKTSSTENRKFPLPIYGKGDDIYNREREEHWEDEDGIRVIIGMRTETWVLTLIFPV